MMIIVWRMSDEFFYFRLPQKMSGKYLFYYFISFFLDFRSSLLTMQAANRDLIGGGSFVATLFALPFDQLFSILKTAWNCAR